MSVPPGGGGDVSTSSSSSTYSSSPSTTTTTTNNTTPTPLPPPPPPPSPRPANRASTGGGGRLGAAPAGQRRRPPPPPPGRPPAAPVFRADVRKGHSKIGFHSTLATLKDGYAHDDRYHCNEKVFDCPNMWVFSNTLPDPEMLSGRSHRLAFSGWCAAGAKVERRRARRWRVQASWGLGVGCSGQAAERWNGSGKAAKRQRNGSGNAAVRQQ